MQCACGILSSVDCPAAQYVSTLSQNGNILKEKLWNIKCVFLFPVQLLSEAFLILRRPEQDMMINVHRCSCKVPFFSCQILMRLEISRHILENYSNNFTKILPLGAEFSMGTDRETNRHDEANSRFSQSCEHT
jgi:hypothetical protein